MRFASSFEFVAGGRYTVDDKGFDFAVTDTRTAAEAASIAASLGRPMTLSPANSAYVVSTNQRWSQFTPRTVLRFERFDGGSLYALWSRGYKGGDYFGTPAIPAAVRAGFNTETVEYREIGFRSRLARGRVVFNVSAFDMNFRDLQIQGRFFLVPGDPTSLANQVTNAAGAKIRGVEADVTARVVDRLNLVASYGSLNAKISRAIAGSNLVVGSPVPMSPSSSLNLALEDTLPLADLGLMTFRPAWHRSGNLYLDINARPTGFQTAYSLQYASVVLDLHNCSVSVWGKKLGDERYPTVANLLPNGATGPVQYGERRTFGVTATRRF